MANVLGELFQNIADAIRSKTGSTDKLKPNEFPAAIEGITAGGGEGEKPFDCHSVTFVYGDKSYVRSVADGDTCADPVERGLIPTPTKESTVQYNYTFYGWGASDGGAADANILKNIRADKTVYAIFTATARLYTITFYDEDGTTVLATKQFGYGTVPSYTPTKDGVVFGGWNPEPVPVTGNASYTVVWSSVLASGTFSGTSVNWTMMSNGTLTISGSGEMPKFKSTSYSGIAGIYYKNSPIYSYASQITKVVIEDGVTKIGECSFYKDYTAIKSVEIADSVTTIGDGAFNYCTSLEEAHIPDSVTSIGSSSFSDCSALTQVHIPTGITTLDGFSNTGLTSVTIPANVTEIASECFFNCTSLVSVTLHDGLTTIALRAFQQCSALAEINLPSTLTYIGNEAFHKCTALKHIEIPAGVTTGGSATFNYSGLESITFASGMTTIPKYMCGYAESLTEVNIPNTVTTIGERAFHACKALKHIEIPGSVETISIYAFSVCSSLESVTFENTVGWWVSTDSAATSGDAVDVSDPITNVTHFQTTYPSYYWKRS